MRPVAHHLSDQQIERLNVESSRLDLPVAELIRRAIDLYLPETSNALAAIFDYKGYTGVVRVNFEWLGSCRKKKFRGIADRPDGQLVFEAPTLEDAKTLFESMVDRDPEILKAFGLKP